MRDRDNQAENLRQMNDEQLAAILRDARQRLFRLRIQAQTDRLDVPSELMRNRRLISRIKTIQGERQRTGNTRT
ncbi:MAG TPA: 50S ribosomal protein L29 [Pirellulaceae bacterium]|nr:50S ribosomal protein L29 [Pirellulaceae bacterium]